MIFLWACRAGEGRGVLTDGSPGTMVPAAPRILLDHIIEHQYQQVRALHWLRGSHHTTHGANSPVEAGAIFLIYWTGDCVNVCPGLVWNREEIINININFLIRRGFNIITSTASNRIHFLGHKINFRNSLCSIKLCLWWPRTEKNWLKCVIVFQKLWGAVIQYLWSQLVTFSNLKSESELSIREKREIPRSVLWQLDNSNLWDEFNTFWILAGLPPPPCVPTSIK